VGHRLGGTNALTLRLLQLLLSFFSSMKPKIKAVQDPDGKKECTSQKKAPHALCKACEDVCEPCDDAQPAKYACHGYS
jgi:hypothetical protein